MTTSRLFILFIAVQLVCGDTTYLTGTLRDQAPAAMWNCGGNPGTANGGAGWSGTDFQIGGYQSPEAGLVGTLCNAANGWFPPACAAIGSDQTPVYAYGDNPSPGHNILSSTSFYHWFHDTDQTFDVPFSLPLTLIPGTSTYSYVNDSFFPLDGIGWTDHCYNSKQVFHNFAYCFEAHTRFGYQGNEVFNFYGDDDVWVYIDGRLVVDLGSIHTKLSATLQLNTVGGLKPGNNYRLDFFYCERHTTESNLEMQTTLQFYCAYTDWCGVCEGNGQSCCTTETIQKYCNDNSLCTTDTCGIQTAPGNGSSGCVHTPITCPAAPNQCSVSSCDPASGCTMTPTNCDDGDACTVDTCDNSVGCQHTKKNCDDSNVCTDDSCVAGSCVNADNSARCNDNNKCTTDTCSPSSGCSNQQISCDDKNACTTDSCIPATGCSNPAVVCDDKNACTNDTCVAATGCQFAVEPCNPPDKCSTASCTASTGCVLKSVNCDDGNACTIDTCDGVAGCLNTPVNCDDGQACTTDSCDATGTCQHVNVGANCGQCGSTTCQYTDACKPNVCNSTTVQCNIVPFSCNDNNACTNDVCSSTTGAAVCQHNTISCPVQDACYPPVCDKTIGCTNTTYICNDNNNCTTDACSSVSGKAVCEFTPVPCETADFCSPASCNPTDGSCINTPVNCNDSNPCTTDMCKSNSTAAYCVNTLITCGDACNPAVCNATTGLCVAQPISCDDLNPCTNDTLSCINGAPVCNHTLILDACDDKSVCTNDFCNSSGTVDNHCTHTNITCTPTICQTNPTCDPVLGCQFENVTCPGVGDYCKVASCDLVAGCISENRVCNVSDPGCYVGTCNSTLSKCIISQRPDYNTATSTVQKGVLCVLVYNKAAKAAVISGGALAGVIVGAAAGAALIAFGGKKGYDFLQARSGAMGNVATNPLYDTPQAGGTSGLYGS